MREVCDVSTNQDIRCKSLQIANSALGEAQKERVDRTQVSQIEYSKDGTARLVGTYNHPKALRQGLDHIEEVASSTRPRVPNADDGDRLVELRLFVVEDLSREVIEQLGYCFDIDPEFFLAHLSNHAWYNIRDPLWNPPSKNVDTARRDWYSLCFSRARYFPSHRLFNECQQAFGLFNVDR